MSNQNHFVIAQCKNRVELVSGDFSNTKVGEFFGRDPKIIGPEPWKVIKLLTPDQQRLLECLQVVMSMQNYEAIMKIFDIVIEVE